MSVKKREKSWKTPFVPLRALYGTNPHMYQIIWYESMSRQWVSHFFLRMSLYSLVPGTKKWWLVIPNATPVTQNHLCRPADLMLQTATHLRKSEPLYCCACHGTCIFANPLQTSHACHRVFDMLQNPHVLLTLARSLWTSKCVLDLDMCFAEQCRPVFEHLKLAKARWNVVCFVHFDLETRFAPQQRALFGHNFLNMWCFLHFDFQICFAPQLVFNLSSPIWPDGSALRFSEPTFRPSGATNH